MQRILLWLAGYFDPKPATFILGSRGMAPMAPALSVPAALVPLPGNVGVMYTPPPPSILPAIMKQVEQATSELEVGDVALTAVADRKGGWNGALVAKLPKGVSVDAWIGKSWAEDAKLDYGVRVLGKWKIGK